MLYLRLFPSLKRCSAIELFLPHSLLLTSAAISSFPGHIFCSSLFPSICRPVPFLPVRPTGRFLVCTTLPFSTFHASSLRAGWTSYVTARFFIHRLIMHLSCQVSNSWGFNRFFAHTLSWLPIYPRTLASGMHENG